MKREIYIRSMKNNVNAAYMVNVRTQLLDTERHGIPLEIVTFSRTFTAPHRCIDHENKPIILNNHILHGDLIYYKQNRFDWKTISLDECISIHAIEN